MRFHVVDTLPKLRDETCHLYLLTMFPAAVSAFYKLSQLRIACSRSTSSNQRPAILRAIKPITKIHSRWPVPAKFSRLTKMGCIPSNGFSCFGIRVRKLIPVGNGNCCHCVVARSLLADRQLDHSLSPV